MYRLPGLIPAAGKDQDMYTTIDKYGKAIDGIKRNEYYKTYFFRYLKADQKTRAASINHWIKCHAENVLSERDDLIIFSAKMLAAALLAEKYAQFKEGRRDHVL